MFLSDHEQLLPHPTVGSGAFSQALKLCSAFQIFTRYQQMRQFSVSRLQAFPLRTHYETGALTDEVQLSQGSNNSLKTPSSGNPMLKVRIKTRFIPVLMRNYWLKKTFPMVTAMRILQLSTLSEHIHLFQSCTSATCTIRNFDTNRVQEKFPSLGIVKRCVLEPKGNLVRDYVDVFDREIEPLLAPYGQTVSLLDLWRISQWTSVGHSETCGPLSAFLQCFPLRVRVFQNKDVDANFEPNLPDKMEFVQRWPPQAPTPLEAYVFWTIVYRSFAFGDADKSVSIPEIRMKLPHPFARDATYVPRMVQWFGVHLGLHLQGDDYVHVVGSTRSFRRNRKKNETSFIF